MKKRHVGRVEGVGSIPGVRDGFGFKLFAAV